MTVAPMVCAVCSWADEHGSWVDMPGFRGLVHCRTCHGSWPRDGAHCARCHSNIGSSDEGHECSPQALRQQELF